jgi:hypothetical protein
MFSSNSSQVSNAANYIEDVFSTYLYTGNGSTQTITNGIDLSTKGGLVWLKSRSQVASHGWFDTLRGANNQLISDSTAAAQAVSSRLDAFTSSGFTLGTYGSLNGSGSTYASWTFRKQPKFFDVVTWTGNNATSRQISHSLGSVPGCIIVKCTSNAANWVVYHRSLSTDSGTVDSNNLVLNSTGAQSGGACFGDDQYQTSTYFTLGRLGSGFNDTFNRSGYTYVAYLFAHDAGGFGLTGTDNVISCGSFTTDSGGNFSVSLGYEPQLVLVKRTDATQNWFIADTMRGFSQSQFATLNPNLSAAETANNSNYISPNATGFGSIGNQFLSGSATYIYIAIRRGPMKVPTSGTSVFAPVAANNTQGTKNTTGFPVDLQLQAWRDGVNAKIAVDRLRGVSTNATNGEKYLVTNTTAAEVAGTSLTQYWDNTGFQTALGWASFSNVYWNFGRAPGFMDVVCYTGTGSATTVSHNLGVAPELIITKKRSSTESWWTWCNYAPNSTNGNYANALNATWAYDNQGTSIWGSTVTRTSAAYSVGSVQEVNGYGITYVAYLFATCAGVSKVGSYTGTGATQTIACGFTGGARFVLVKRTDSTGDWYVWDTARGMVSGTDPSLLLNSTAAEVNANSIYTTTGGFQIVSTAAGINASGGTYIFLAIA